MEPNTPTPNSDPIDTLTQQIRDLLEHLQLTSQELLDQSAASMNQHLADGEKALDHLKAMREHSHLIVNRQQEHYRAIEALGLQYFEKVATDAGGAQAQLFGERILAGYQSVMNKTTDKTLQAASKLQDLLQRLSWRVIGMFAAAMVPICIAVGLFLVAWKIDTAYSVRKQEAQKAQIAPIIANLKKTGQRLDVIPCPNDTRGRYCVRTDPNATRFGYRQELVVLD